MNAQVKLTLESSSKPTVTALDMTVKEFCEQENLSLVCDGDSGARLRVNDRFCIRFGKPEFDLYLKRCALNHWDR